MVLLAMVETKRLAGEEGVAWGACRGRKDVGLGGGGGRAIRGGLLAGLISNPSGLHLRVVDATIWSNHTQCLHSMQRQPTRANIIMSPRPERIVDIKLLHSTASVNSKLTDAPVWHPQMRSSDHTSINQMTKT